MEILNHFDGQLRRFLLLILLVTLLSLLAVILVVPTEFHVWEIPIDVRIIAFICIPILLYSVDFLRRRLLQFGISKWRWKSNVAAFSLPIAFFAVIIITPQFWGKDVWDDLGNSPTTMLAALLDVPALYVVSLAVVLFEEILFRGFLLREIRERQNVILSIGLTTLIWVVASSEKIFQAGDTSTLSLASGFVYLASVGLASSAIFCHTNSIWNCYSYRIGLQVVSSLIFGAGMAYHREYLSFPLIPLYIIVPMIFFNIAIAIFFGKRAKPLKILA